MTNTQTTFVLASQNRGKLKEMQEILGRYGIRVVLQSELGLTVAVEETGNTFLENAALKAKAVCEASGLAAIADDSGLMVDALGGAPGVYSARYGGLDSDEARNAFLLENMKSVPREQRGAQFVCAIVAAFPDGRTIQAQGLCRGEILQKPLGEGGFGYDPLFWVQSEQMTFAQLPAERKNRLSHRAKALGEFSQKLQSIQGENHADE